MKKFRSHSLFAILSGALLNFACGTAFAGEPDPYSTKLYDSDAAISQRVQLALQNQPGVNAGNVKVEVFQGMVQLSGHMESHVELVTALAVVERVDGIKTVRDYLVEDAPQPSAEFTVEIAQESVTSSVSALEVASNGAGKSDASNVARNGIQ